MSKFFHSAGFRFTLLTASIFSLCVLVLGGIIFYDVRESLEGQLRQRIKAEHAQLIGDYEEDGLDELRHDIRERIEANPAGRLLYFVQGPTGKVIFDRIGAPSQQQGWTYHEYNQRSFLLYTTSLENGYSLGIAADLREVKDGEKAVLHASGMALLAMLVLSLIAGTIISHLFMRQIDRIAQAAQEIGEGNLTRRLPVTGSQDDLDRLADIINRMLDRIQALVENVQRVSASIAHDLRTPLGHVRQKLDSLKEIVTDEQTPHVDAALEQLGHVMDTFAALLRIAEIESGTRKAAFQQIDISALLNQLAETFQPVAEEHHQKIITNIAPDIQMSADKALLTQLCVNVIENAIHYSGQNSTIQIELLQRRHHITLSIADNGKGVPSEELPKLTTPFYRMEASRTSRGNGLGLSLVKAIADLHGMTLTLGDNQPGLRVEMTI